MTTKEIIERRGAIDSPVSLRRERKERTPSSSAIQPIAVTIPDAEIISGLSRPTLYRRNKEGVLPFRKVKGRTLVMVDDLRRMIVGEAA